jgi:cephalosporin-C deacetylase
MKTLLRAKSLFLVGAALAAISSVFSAQDIVGFWAQTRADLARVPMDARVETLKDPLPYKTFLITLRGLNGVEFRALLALPVQGEAPAKPWPVIVTVAGYGGTQQGVMLSECQRGYAILQMFPRGQDESADLCTSMGPTSSRGVSPNRKMCTTKARSRM